jgi:hypothetical protein
LSDVALFRRGGTGHLYSGKLRIAIAGPRNEKVAPCTMGSLKTKKFSLVLHDLYNLI